MPLYSPLNLYLIILWILDFKYIYIIIIISVDVNIQWWRRENVCIYMSKLWWWRVSRGERSPPPPKKKEEKGFIAKSRA